MKVRKVSNTLQFDPDEIKNILTIEQLLDGVDTTPASNGELKCICPLPGHEDDTNPSFNFGDNVFYCHGCNRGGDIFELYMFLHEVDFQEAITKLAKMANVKPMGDIFYNYYDVDNKLTCRKIRHPDKTWGWQRLENSNWLTGLAGKPPPLYKLQDLINNPTKVIFVVEGEKDTNTVSGSLGLITTTAGGNTWLNDYVQYFVGRQVVILPDNDNPGHAKANQIALALLSVAGEVKLVNLPNLKDKEDVTDWVNKGGTRDQLIQLVKDTSLYEPERTTLDGWKLLELADNRPLVTELVNNVVWGGESTLFFAREKAGKTTFLISAIINSLKNNKKVFWAAGRSESSILDVVQRIVDLGCKMTKTNKLFFGNNRSYESFENFAADVEYFQPDIIVIDSLTSILVDFNEKAPELSDDAGWSKSIGRFTELVRDTSIGLVLIHHTAKVGIGNYKGNTMIGAKVDNLISMAGGRGREYTTLKLGCRNRTVADIRYTYDIIDDRYQLCDIVLASSERELWLYDYLKNPVVTDGDKQANIIYKAAKLQGYSREAIRLTVKGLGIDISGGRGKPWQVTDKTEIVIKEIQEKNEKIKGALEQKRLDSLSKTDVDETKEF